MIKWSCTYLELEILPCTPTVELCATSTDSSTTFGILQLRTSYDNQQFSQGAQGAFSKYHIWLYYSKTKNSLTSSMGKLYGHADKTMKNQYQEHTNKKSAHALRA